MGYIKKFFEKKKMEYKESMAANKMIRKKASMAAMKERELQAIKTARYKEQQRGKMMRMPSSSGGLGNVFSGLNAMTGGMMSSPKKEYKIISKRVPIKKKMKKKYRIVRTKVPIKKPMDDPLRLI